MFGPRAFSGIQDHVARVRSGRKKTQAEIRGKGVAGKGDFEYEEKRNEARKKLRPQPSYRNTLPIWWLTSLLLQVDWDSIVTAVSL